MLDQVQGMQAERGVEEFAGFIESARDRLHAEREQIANRQDELRRKMDEIDRELAAIGAYETAKSGKAIRGNPVVPPARRSDSRRTGQREKLLDLINRSNGLSRGEILDLWGIKGDKGAEISVSNALTAMTKQNKVRREDGKYYPATAESLAGKDHEDAPRFGTHG